MTKANKVILDVINGILRLNTGNDARIKMGLSLMVSCKKVLKLVYNISSFGF